MINDQAEIPRLMEMQRVRNASLSRGATLTQDELDVLEVFWNHHFHKRRDRVPLVVVLDHAVRKLTLDPDNSPAYDLARERIKALMLAGYLYEDIVSWSGGKIPSGAELQLNNEGVAHFSAGFPAALRNPLLFAKRHLSLFQLLGVVASVTFAVATFLLKVFAGV